MSIYLQEIPEVCRQRHPYGTIMYGSSYLEYLENAQQWYNTHKQGKKVLALSYLNDSRISALRASVTEFLNVMDFLDDLRYECPYTKHLNYWAVPIAIITEDIGIYMKQPSIFFDMASDLAWTLDHHYVFDEDGNLALNKIDKAWLGASYTHGTIPSDGSSSRVSYMTPLSNGDILLSSGWMWHNK